MQIKYKEGFMRLNCKIENVYKSVDMNFPECKEKFVKTIDSFVKFYDARELSVLHNEKLYEIDSIEKAGIVYDDLKKALTQAGVRKSR